MRFVNILSYLYACIWHMQQHHKCVSVRTYIQQVCAYSEIKFKYVQLILNIVGVFEIQSQPVQQKIVPLASGIVHANSKNIQ